MSPQPFNAREKIHNEIHLLVARVQAANNLGEQINHGNDFVERFVELFSLVEEKARAEERKKILGRIHNILGSKVSGIERISQFHERAILCVLSDKYDDEPKDATNLLK